jgi:hypothetical protein
VIAVRTVAFVRLCWCAVRASKQRAAGTKGRWRTGRVTRGWRFEAVARGLGAVRTSLLPRPRCVTSARHPFGGLRAACRAGLASAVRSALARAGARARSSRGIVNRAVYRPTSRNFPKRYPLRRYAPGTLARIRTHLRIPRPIPKYTRTRCVYSIHLSKSSRTIQPRMYTHPPVRIRTHHRIYTHMRKRGARCVYTQPRMHPTLRIRREATNVK